jgi:hydroxyacylglutathione hydrolase
MIEYLCAVLHFESITFGPFAENTWIVSHPDGQCWIVDPGCYGSSEEGKLLDYIQSHRLKPVGLLNTHAHIDHILGNAFVHNTWNLQPLLHPLDLEIYRAAPQYSQMWGIRTGELPEPDLVSLTGKELCLGDAVFEIRFTPGHTPGEVCLIHHASKTILAADVLFRGSIGRTDLPGGDYETLIRSIRSELLSLPDDYRVCSGHGPDTTIGYERLNNPFLQ